MGRRVSTSSSAGWKCLPRVGGNSSQACTDILILCGCFSLDAVLPRQWSSSQKCARSNNLRFYCRANDQRQSARIQKFLVLYSSQSPRDTDFEHCGGSRSCNMEGTVQGMAAVHVGTLRPTQLIICC